MEGPNGRKESVEVGPEATTPKPPRASEKRRQQNRLAQKNYREKQKKRLQAFERLAVSIVAPSLSNEPIVPTSHEHSVSDLASQLPLADSRDLGTPGSANIECLNIAEAIGNEIDAPWRLGGQELPSALPWNVEVRTNNVDLLQPEGSIDTLFEADLSLNHWSIGQDIFPNTEIDPPTHDLPTPAQIHSLMPSGILSSDSYGNSLSAGSFAMPESLEYRPETLAEQLLKPDFERLSKDTIGTASNGPVARSQTTTPIGRSQHTQSQKTRPTWLANLYVNHLRIHTISLISACTDIAFHLGISEIAFCSEDSVSCFYRPRLTESAHSETLITAVQNAFQGIKRDLRPQRAQITISHHPYIDCIPFPSMRERVIELQAHDPPLIDEDGLLHDILIGGMVCWGGHMPAKGMSVGGGGAPWDMRSWEAMDWFLEKWAFVVGGADGEVWRQTMWWREMRGD